jgi:hypothetical protein
MLARKVERGAEVTDYQRIDSLKLFVNNLMNVDRASQTRDRENRTKAQRVFTAARLEMFPFDSDKDRQETARRRSNILVDIEKGYAPDRTQDATEDRDPGPSHQAEPLAWRKLGGE